VVWRAGLDLNPLRVNVDADMAWLATLVWPEQLDRLARLNGAVEVAKIFDPGVVCGDLRTDLIALAAQAPGHATLVVFHTAVLGYVRSQRERDAFALACSQLGAIWIRNEWPNVFPNIASKVDATPMEAMLCGARGRRQN
jgi:hypothetical protein